MILEFLGLLDFDLGRESTSVAVAVVVVVRSPLSLDSDLLFRSKGSDLDFDMPPADPEPKQLASRLSYLSSSSSSLLLLLVLSPLGCCWCCGDGCGSLVSTLAGDLVRSEMR